VVAQGASGSGHFVVSGSNHQSFAQTRMLAHPMLLRGVLGTTDPVETSRTVAVMTTGFFAEHFPAAPARTDGGTFGAGTVDASGTYGIAAELLNDVKRSAVQHSLVKFGTKATLSMMALVRPMEEMPECMDDAAFVKVM
jgi:hypothetical protein